MERSLINDIRDSFKAKGLEYVSVKGAAADQKKSVLTYKDGTGKVITKEISMALEELEDTVAEIDEIDPDDLATYLLESGGSSV